MRDAQKRYFRSRAKTDLLKAKEAERRFDETLQDIIQFKIIKIDEE